MQVNNFSPLSNLVLIPNRALSLINLTGTPAASFIEVILAQTLAHKFLPLSLIPHKFSLLRYHLEDGDLTHHHTKREPCDRLGECGGEDAEHVGEQGRLEPGALQG